MIIVTAVVLARLSFQGQPCWTSFLYFDNCQKQQLQQHGNNRLCKHLSERRLTVCSAPHWKNCLIVSSVGFELPAVTHYWVVKSVQWVVARPFLKDERMEYSKSDNTVNRAGWFDCFWNLSFSYICALFIYMIYMSLYIYIYDIHMFSRMKQKCHIRLYMCIMSWL